MSTGKQANRAAAERRLEAALRENLKRRKAQARGREAASVGKAAAADENDGDGGREPENS